MANTIQGRQIGQAGSLAGMLNNTGIFNSAARGLNGLFGGNGSYNTTPNQGSGGLGGIFNAGNESPPQGLPMPESPGYRPSQNYGGESPEPDTQDSMDFWKDW